MGARRRRRRRQLCRRRRPSRGRFAPPPPPRSSARTRGSTPAGRPSCSGAGSGTSSRTARRTIRRCRRSGSRSSARRRREMTNRRARVDSIRASRLDRLSSSPSWMTRTVGAMALRAGHFALDHAQGGLMAAVVGFKLLEWWYGAAEDAVFRRSVAPAAAAAAEDGAAPSRVRGAAGPRAVPAVPAAVFPARGGAHERVGVLSPVRRGRGSAIRTVPGDARGGGGGRRRASVQRVMRRPRRRQLCRMCRRRRRRPFGFRIWTPVASLAADGVTRFRCNQMTTSSRIPTWYRLGWSAAVGARARGSVPTLTSP